MTALYCVSCGLPFPASASCHLSFARLAELTGLGMEKMEEELCDMVRASPLSRLTPELGHPRLATETIVWARVRAGDEEASLCAHCVLVRSRHGFARTTRDVVFSAGRQGPMV